MRGSKLVLWSLCLIGATALVTGRALSQDAEPSDAVKNGMKAYQAIFDAARAPVEAHDLLKRFSGEWTGASKTWTTFTAKDAPLTAEWKRTGTLVMDGIFMSERVEGSFVGAEFEGMGILGYDKDTKQYVVSQVNNLGTGQLTLRGTLDADGKVLTLVSEEQARMGMKFTMKEVLTWVSDDHVNMQMISIYQGGMEVKEVEIDWKRVK